MARLQGLSINLNAFLDMIGFSEGTTTIAGSDDGYNVEVGGTLFEGYADHPRKLVILNANLKSTAAGRYQILAKFFDFYKKQLNLPDFSPESQDKIAIQMMKEVHALNYIELGNFSQAVKQSGSRWASLPGNTYGQRQVPIADLQTAYINAGGIIT
jgi:muramidase (phage lysozyme)